MSKGNPEQTLGMKFYHLFTQVRVLHALWKRASTRSSSHEINDVQMASGDTAATLDIAEHSLAADTSLDNPANVPSLDTNQFIAGSDLMDGWLIDMADPSDLWDFSI